MKKRQPDYYRVKEDDYFWDKKFSTKSEAEKFARERRASHIGTGKHGIYVFSIRIKGKPKKKNY